MSAEALITTTHFPFTNVEMFKMTFSHWFGKEYYRMPNGWRNAHLIVFEVGNILGYFDYIGPIVGIARIIFAVTQLNNGSDAQARIPFIARGLLEISLLRICLVPIDLINTYLLPKHIQHFLLDEIIIEKEKTE